MENFCALKLTRIDDVWFGPGEGWGYHDLTLFQEDIKAQMVTIQRPAPRLLDGRVAEHKKVIRELIHDLGHIADLSQEMIDPHRRQSLLVAYSGKAGFKDSEN